MGFKIVRHTPYRAVYLFIDAVKALRRVRALQHANADFVLLDARSDRPMTFSELERAVTALAR